MVMSFITVKSSVLPVDGHLRCIPIHNYIDTMRTADSTFFSFELYNKTRTIQDIILEIPINQIDTVVILQKVPDRIITFNLFYSKRIADRAYYDRDIVYEFRLQPLTKYNFTVAASKNNIHFKHKPDVLIWNKDAKIFRTQALELTRGVFYGILMLYIIICFYLWYLLRAKNYLYYSLYLIMGGLYLFIKNNLAYELFWPNNPNIDIFFKKIMLSIYLISSIVFFRGFIARRIERPVLQDILRYFIYLGLLLTGVSLLVGLLSTPAQNAFIVIQNIFTYVCFGIIVLSFIFAWLNVQERSLIFFTFAYFISFAFFLYYPMPEFGKDISGVYIGQIYTYSNAFIISTIISLTTIFRVLQIIRNNEKMKREVSVIHANQNFSIIQGQLNERKRVGQELHDGIGIMMSAIKMKLSTIKTNNPKELAILKSLIRDVDRTCDDIRSFSHELLPPTLQKFGLATALKDEVEKYKNSTGLAANFNCNIPSDLTDVSAFLTYDFIISILQYFRKNKPDSLSISVYIIASIQHAQIRINYTGHSIDLQSEEMRSIQSMIELLHGKTDRLLINAWTFRLDLEYPVLMKQEPKFV